MRASKEETSAAVERVWASVSEERSEAMSVLALAGDAAPAGREDDLGGARMDRERERWNVRFAVACENKRRAARH